jgi:P-type Ca2+ transporter type 2C
MSYRKSYDEIFEIFNSNIDGLTEKDAKQKLKENGLNELNKQKRISIFKLLFDSFTSPLVIILLIAVFVQILMGEMAESVIILIVVFLNAILEVVQSKKAESSLESLKKTFCS